MNSISRISTFLPGGNTLFDGQYSQDIPDEELKTTFLAELEKQLIQPGFQAITTDNGVLLSRRLEWDSNYFGFPVHKLEHLWSENKAAASNLVHLYLEKLRAENYSYTFARVQATDSVTQNALAGAGFELMLHKVMLRCEITKNSIAGAPKSKTSLTIRPARPEDKEFVIELAGRSAMTSRFTLDEKIDQGLAEGIYRNWARNIFSNPESILVADYMGERAGIVALADANSLYFPDKFPDYPMGFISLVAVDDRFRGKAVGRSLISEAILRYNAKGYKAVFANTALQNKASLTMFQNAGFQVFSMVSEFRCWL